MEVSSEKQAWAGVASGTILDPTGYTCDSFPTEEFAVATVAGRFVRFDMRMFSGLGLRYFGVVRGGVAASTAPAACAPARSILSESPALDGDYAAKRSVLFQRTCFFGVLTYESFN